MSYADQFRQTEKKLAYIKHYLDSIFTATNIWHMWTDGKYSNVFGMRLLQRDFLHDKNCVCYWHHRFPIESNGVPNAAGAWPCFSVWHLESENGLCKFITAL